MKTIITYTILNTESHITSLQTSTYFDTHADEALKLLNAKGYKSLNVKKIEVA